MAKRDAAYFRARLKRDHPAIHAELIAGRLPSVRAAAIAAGIVKPRRRVTELQNAFLKASGAEKDEFLDWLLANYGQTARRAGASTVGKLTVVSTQPAAPRSALTQDRHLEPWARVRIQEILNLKGWKAGTVMADMGSNVRDASLGMALLRDTKLTRLDPAKLDDWIQRWSATLNLP